MAHCIVVDLPLSGPSGDFPPLSRSFAHLLTGILSVLLCGGWCVPWFHVCDHLYCYALGIQHSVSPRDSIFDAPVTPMSVAQCSSVPDLASMSCSLLSGDVEGPVNTATVVDSVFSSSVPVASSSRRKVRFR
jgi:hypothetical protein